jgi:hypothetical protein
VSPATTPGPAPATAPRQPGTSPASSVGPVALHGIAGRGHWFPDFDPEGALAELRRAEYGRLDQGEHVYLHYTGGGLHSVSQIDAHIELLCRRLLGNPHSNSPASIASTELVEQTRRDILEFFNAPANDCLCVFRALLFFVEFFARLTIGISRSPIGLLAGWMTQRQPPHWVSAQPKRFAWTLGLAMSGGVTIITTTASGVAAKGRARSGPSPAVVTQRDAIPP